MAISISQHTTHTASFTTSHGITVSAVAAGDIALVCVRFDRAPGTTGVSGLGATWTKLQSTTAGSTTLELWAGVGASSGTSITVTSTANAYQSVAVQIWTGGASILTSGYVPSASTNSPRTGYVSTSAANQGVAGFWIGSGLTSDTYTYTDAPGAWTQQDALADGTVNAMVMSYARLSGAAEDCQRQGVGAITATYVGFAAVIAAAGDPALPTQPTGYVSSVTSTSGNNVIGFTIPPAVQPGNVIYAAVGCYAGTNGFTAPTGWTLLANNTGAATGYNCRVLVYRRDVVMGDAGQPANWTFTNGDVHAKVIAAVVYNNSPWGSVVTNTALSTAVDTSHPFSTGSYVAGQNYLRFVVALNGTSAPSFTFASGGSLGVTKRAETNTTSVGEAVGVAVGEWAAATGPGTDPGNTVSVAQASMFASVSLRVGQSYLARDAETTAYENTGIGPITSTASVVEYVMENSGIGPAVASTSSRFSVYENSGLGPLVAKTESDAYAYEFSTTVPNDTFATAHDLGTATSGVDQAVTTGYGTEASEPFQFSTTGATAWWKWKPGPGTTTIDTFGSTFDTDLTVYKGAAGASITDLTYVTLNRDSFNSTYYNQSQVSFTADGTSTYYIQVGGWNGATGTVTLNYNGYPPPTVIDTAVAFTRSHTSAAAAIAGVTRDATTTFTRSRSLVAVVQSIVAKTATATLSRSRSLTATGIARQRAVNDNFANATNIGPITNVTTDTVVDLAGSLALCTAESGEPHGPSISSVWYTFTTSADFEGTVDVRFTGLSSGYVVASLYTGGSVNALTELDPLEFNTWVADPGTTYYLQVRDPAMEEDYTGTVTFSPIVRGTTGGIGTAGLMDVAIWSQAPITAPGSLTVSVVNAGASATVYFTIDGAAALETDADESGTLTSLAIPLDNLDLGTHTLTATANGVDATADFDIDVVILGGDVDPNPSPTPPPTVNPDVTHWVLSDPYSHDTYTFPRNPSQTTSPFAPRSFQFDTTTGINGQGITFEGAKKAAPFSFSGKIMEKDFYDALSEWCNRRRRVFLTDHFGRVWEVVLYSFQPKPVLRQRGYEWLTDYTVNAYITRGPL